jgi:prophage regulatory protein
MKAKSAEPISPPTPETLESVVEQRHERLRMLRLAEVMQLTSLSKTTIYCLQAQGRFPQAVHVTPRAVRWIESEISAWIREQMENRAV